MTEPIHPLAGLFAFAAKLATGAQARWFNCLPDTRQCVYFANHTSHLDLLVVWASLHPEIRGKTRPVAAKDYWCHDRIRRYIASQVFRAVMVERTDRAVASHGAMAPLLKALDEGASLILFPEGSRGTGEEVAPFKSGLYHLCRMRPELHAAPVYLENLNRVLPKGEFLPVPILSRVTFGPPISLESGESKEEFLTRARAAVCQLRNI
jgi:1-acyl-sn-glycerol-3-phosphate acyltransferase